ncbi:MAG TPA: tRNA pseudouridine(55) synthase TruB [Candidatus Saccharimonadales bacterium]|nr:tRNA pseudouridine(55) synthase TruB [Candidatus Saccharimonadales bacterium]
MDGVLIINKPAGFTSHDVVARARGILGERSIGHLGTLDPAATGVLPLVVGRFTRLAQFYNEADKRYEGTIRFGWATDTYDAQGEPQGQPQPVHLTEQQVREAAGRHVGHIQQMPPPFSAKKIGGIPAYKLARKKQEVVLEPKAVEIKELEITGWNGSEARFRAWVSSGTYIRTLAHELGQQLGPGAHLAELVRTAVREFTLTESYTLADLGEAAATGALDRLFLHPRLVLPEFPAVTAPPESVARIRHGGTANLPEFSKAPMIRVFDGQRDMLAIARRIAGTLFQPRVVLHGAD